MQLFNIVWNATKIITVAPVVPVSPESIFLPAIYFQNPLSQWNQREEDVLTQAIFQRKVTL